MLQEMVQLQYRIMKEWVCNRCTSAIKLDVNAIYNVADAIIMFDDAIIIYDDGIIMYDDSIYNIVDGIFLYFFDAFFNNKEKYY